MLSRKSNKVICCIGLGLLISGCANNSKVYNSTDKDRISSLEMELKQTRSALEKQRQDSSANLNAGNNQASILQSEQLLPPGAKSGECYARVWVEPTYTTKQKQIIVKEASQTVSIIPAQYEWYEEQVIVKEASTKITEVPAVFTTESETIKVRDSERLWVSDLKKRKPVSSELLRSAKNGGINLDNAEVNSCYHEHVLPAETRTVEQTVEVSPSTFKIETVPAQYQWIEKRVMVKEASSKLVKVPAKYETYSEQIIDKPAHTTWKKGTGPIQKIDEATGEIMCLVDVPATYKTISRSKLISPETVQEIIIPAEYETVKVRELIAQASEQRTEIPAQYRTVNVTEKVSEPEFIWHEVHDKTHTAHTRTGNKICLVETPAQYKTITRQVVVNEARTQTIDIPAVYETKKVRRLVSGPQEVRQDIPAVEKVVEYRELKEEGFMDWRSILCETNTTPNLISTLQRRLNEKGYDSGSPDGVVGKQTIQAVNSYQADNNLPVDKHLNIDTLKHLNVL